MPSMNEIYDEHALAYDELVSREDYEGNLGAFLSGTFDFTGKTVIEPGAGTGRLTALYIQDVARARLFDRSVHMLEQAKTNLAPWTHKIECTALDNLQLDSISGKADFVIEGWSFGHAVAENRHDIDMIVDRLVESCHGLVNPGGHVILVETLGTKSSVPSPPGQALARFYELLQTRHGFGCSVLATDYRFPDVMEAARVMGYFFGPDMAKGILESGSPIVNEFTGIWYARID